jgi:hypothetical protein
MRNGVVLEESKEERESRVGNVHTTTMRNEGVSSSRICGALLI